MIPTGLAAHDLAGSAGRLEANPAIACGLTSWHPMISDDADEVPPSPEEKAETARKAVELVMRDVEAPVTREIGMATVTLRLDSLVRSAVYRVVDLVDLWIGGPGGRSPSLQIVVTNRDTGRVVWRNHGYGPASDPLGAFEEICRELDFFELRGFLRRHRGGFWSR